MKDDTTMTTDTGTDTIRFFLVGGAVRDLIMGRTPKDFDFTVVAESYVDMRDTLIENGFKIFLEDEGHFTVRAKRSGPWHFGGLDLSNKTFDFVLARKEGAYADGRHPDSVEPGTLLDDLARRDFTMNAIALDWDGNYIDPFDGARDIKTNFIRCVGGVERLYEDGLRMVRALRFAVTLDFVIDLEETAAMRDPANMKYLENVSVDRIRSELYKCFGHDTLETLWILDSFPALRNALLSGNNLWLKPTLEKR